MKGICRTLMSTVGIFILISDVQGQVNTKDSVKLYSGYISVGDDVFIHGAYDGPPMVEGQYQYIYKRGYNGKLFQLRNMAPHDCTIVAFWKDGKKDMATLVEKYGGDTLEAVIRQAVLEREVEIFGSKFSLRFNLFHNYLKTLENITDADAETYMHQFVVVPRNANEFEKKRAITSLRGQLEALRKTAMNTSKGQKLFDDVKVSQYDFATKSFTLTDIRSSAKFEMGIGNVNGLILNLTNLSDELKMPLDEQLAEKITKEHFQQGRWLYCVYSFDVTGTTTIRDRYGDGFSAGIGTFWVQQAKVYKVDVYLDQACTTKLTTIEFK